MYRRKITGAAQTGHLQSQLTPRFQTPPPDILQTPAPFLSPQIWHWRFITRPSGMDAGDNICFLWHPRLTHASSLTPAHCRLWWCPLLIQHLWLSVSLDFFELEHATLATKIINTGSALLLVEPSLLCGTLPSSQFYSTLNFLCFLFYLPHASGHDKLKLS